MLHIFDDAICPMLLRSLWAGWPNVSWRGWHQYASGDSVKYATRDAEQIPRAAWPCLYAMAECVRDIADECEAFIDWELAGAGLHMMPPGGWLRPHLDSDVMPGTGWRREYSCVLCVNPRWDADWGGEFRLNGSRVLPQYNRLIVFACTESAVHEVTKVLGPEPRCTLSLFLWSRNYTPGKRSTASFT